MRFRRAARRAVVAVRIGPPTVSTPGLASAKDAGFEWLAPFSLEAVSRKR